MASTPFTLAALATSAVPGLTVSGTRAHTSGSGGSFTSAVLTTDVGDVIVRIPEEPAAEVQQSAELLALAAIVEGARARLPFDVPTTLGMTRAKDTRAVVSTFLRGTPAGIEELEGDAELLQAIAEALAAIHSLPSGIVREGGLPLRNAEEARAAAARLVRRAADTGLLPATVRQRWNEVLDADGLWSFEPTVVHGSLAPESLLVDGSELLGVLGWSELALGDPALDLGWMLAAEPNAFESVLVRYATVRGISGQQELATRARFYHELEVAKWLLHGTETHDQGVVDDAVNMLDRMVDRLGLMGAPLPQRRVLSEHEVERLLDETPEVDYDLRSETAEFESLDEDRAFAADEDFEGADEHLERVRRGGAAAEENASESDAAEDGAATGGAGTGAAMTPGTESGETTVSGEDRS